MGAEIKTKKTDADVDAFLDAAPANRRDDAFRLRDLIEKTIGDKAAMWGPSMVGFGSKPYTNTLGTNDWFIIGFSPRKAALTIYGLHDGYGPNDPLLDELGPHTASVSCLYVKRLDDLDQKVLVKLIKQAWKRK